MAHAPLVPASPISAAAIDTAFLEQGMEARARNLDQYDPSAAVDSHLERIEALALRLPPGPEREGILAEVQAAIASNIAEAEAELALCGAADKLVHDLRTAERTGTRDVLGAKAIARHLRPALETYITPEFATPKELADARDILRYAVAEIPRLMLLSTAVERELGAGKFALLLSMVEKGAAAGSSRDDAEAEREGARREQI